jgi:ketosteroid isomerase-like protein
VISFPLSADARPSCRFTAHDAAGIRATIARYRERWLAGDAEGVMATFTREPILLPPGSAPPFVGQTAVRGFWFPPGPATKVTRLDITVEEVGGDCKVGWARGLDAVEWAGTGGAIHGNAGTYLNVMQKGADGVWRISHHMWDDDPKRRR